jgi:hypothetical protein
VSELWDEKKSDRGYETAYIDVKSVPINPLSLHILDHYSGNPQDVGDLFWILNLLVFLLVLPHYYYPSLEASA